MLYGAMLAAFAATPASIERELALIDERAYHVPHESLAALAKLQASQPGLSMPYQARILELESRARLGTGDARGALAQATLLEALGRAEGNQTVECLGMLQQVYASHALGNIQAAHALALRTQQFQSSAISATARVKALLTMAQVHDQMRDVRAGQRAVEEALRIARLHNDAGLLFMATKMQAEREIRANALAPASNSVDRLLALARQSPYREQLVRATLTEYAFASAAGQTARASRVMDETIGLMQDLSLEEALGHTLVNYADLQLKSNRFTEAAALSSQALGLKTVQADKELAATAQFNRALAWIRLGKLVEGKREVEQVFARTTNRSDLLTYLPEYIAALTHQGDVDAALQAGVLVGKVQVEEDLGRARRQDASQLRIASLDRENRLRVLEAAGERATRNAWQAAAITAVAGLMGIVLLYRRLRASKRLLEEANRQLTISNDRDFLTGLFNRRYLERVARELSSDIPASGQKPAPEKGLVLLIDIDHFKQINDRYGHAAGDGILRVMAERLSAFVKDGAIARWGGEEFLVLLPSADIREAEDIAARVLDTISRSPFITGDLVIPVSISVGICPLGLAFSDRRASWDEILHLADGALYMAKRDGRNRAYGITGPVRATAKEMSRGLSINRDEGKLRLLEVVAVPQPTLHGERYASQPRI